MGKQSRSGMNNPDHISKSLETIFWVKILQFFDADPACGFRDGKNSDPGWKKFGSGINIPDPQHQVSSFSNCTSVQTSVSGVNTTVKDMKEVIGTLEEKLELLSATTNNIDSKLQVSQYQLWALLNRTKKGKAIGR
jgi:hypothetical protein